jgi:UDP-N-acetylmuramoyl-tripeptide--D-alanyl-D-alanine ligase
MYGVERHLDEVDLRGVDFSMTTDGMEFTLVRSRTGESVRCRTQLLGRHNVSNTLAASLVALHLGLTLEEIAAGLKTLSPVEHRLELKRGLGGLVILDDAYNSNPDGARNALEVLSMFKGRRRILITPGFVELGEREAIENELLGKTAAASCDTAILVGLNRTKPIRDGLEQAGATSRQIVVVPTLHDAIAQLRRIASPGDVVLLLNDLPDSYELVG